MAPKASVIAETGGEPEASASIALFLGDISENLGAAHVELLCLNSHTVCVLKFEGRSIFFTGRGVTAYCLIHGL